MFLLTTCSFSLSRLPLVRACQGADSDRKEAELTYTILAQLIGWDDEVDYSRLSFLETAEICGR